MGKTRHASWARVLLLAGLVLVMNVGPGRAQAPEEGLGRQDLVAAAFVSPAISYQGKLFQDGSPVRGTRAMVFRLYDETSGGTLLWEEGPQSVSVSDGVFSVFLGASTPLDAEDFDQALWLEVVVEGTVLPRQPLTGAPYALSLAPGSNVRGAIDGVQSVLFVDNDGTGYGLLADSAGGHGVYARSSGSGLDGAAVYARAMTAGGVALWAENAHASSSDVALAVSNNGSGDLIVGYGGDGGGSEFRVENDGTLQSRADSYLFVPGIEFVKNLDSENTHWDCQTNGSVKIWSDSAATSRRIFVPITLPAVLYGQEVEVKSLRVYYVCEDAAGGYINGTYLYSQLDADSEMTLAFTMSAHNSTVATSYTLTPSDAAILSADQGILTLLLDLHLDAGDADQNYVQLGGLRVQLGHHGGS